MATYREDLHLGRKVPLVETDDLMNRAVTTDKMADGSVNTNKIANDAVTEEKMANESVSTPKIKDGAVTDKKLKEQSVTTPKIADKSVTTQKIEDKSVTTQKIADKAVTTQKIEDKSVTTQKIADKAVTREKVAEGALGIESFDKDLQNLIKAATGLDDDLLKEFQDLTENMDELQDAVFPIVLTLSVSYSNKKHSVSFTVKEKGTDFIGDTLSLVRTLANGTSETITDVPAASGSYSLDVKSNREIFRLDVTKVGRTSKSSSVTRYICYAGASASAEINEGIINGFTMYSSANVAFNPSVGTANGQYIWLVVPSYLTINKVTSGGFDVTLEAAKTITTALGEFKAYRTANTLTAQSLNLVIS